MWVLGIFFQKNEKKKIGVIDLCVLNTNFAVSGRLAARAARFEYLAVPSNTTRQFWEERCGVWGVGCGVWGLFKKKMKKKMKKKELGS